MNDRLYLEKILGGKTKVKILLTLFIDEDRIYYEKELSDMCDACGS